MSTEAAESISPRLAPIIDEAHLSRSVIRLAWPIIVQQMSLTMVQLVDTALVGHLGQDALAGVRLAVMIFWLSQAGMVALGIGATAIISRNVGAGQPQLASVSLRNALFLAAIWGLAIGMAMWFLSGWALGVMGAEPEAKHQGAVYLKAAAVGLPLASILYVGNASLQGAGDTRTPMAIGIVVNVVNIVVAVLLINGLGPFPRLEVLGAGAGFTGSAIIGFLLVTAVLASGTRIIRWFPWEAFRFNRGEAQRILNVGVPGGLEQVQFSIAFLVYTRIIASLGTTALAAHGVILAVQGLTFGIGFALGIAAAALVGQSLGAGRPDLAERAAYTAVRFALIVMVAIAIILAAFGGPITSIFVGGPDADEVIDIGRRLFLIFAFAMPAMGLSLSLGGGLRGAGDTRAVLAIMTATTWILRLVPAYLLAITFGFGVPGAWAAAVIDINSRALLIGLRFRQGKWKRIKV